MKKLTTEEYANKYFAKFPEMTGKISFDNTVYTRNNTVFTVKCEEHGEVSILPMNLMKGQGLSCCNVVAGRNSITKDVFVERFMAKFPESIYTFEKFVYKTSVTKAIVTCPVHGDFSIKPNKLMSGISCKQCALDSKAGTTADFLSKYIDRHGSNYSFDKFEYTRSNRKSIVICDKHGEFEISPNNLLKGEGCSKCNTNRTSKPEAELYNFILANTESRIIRSDREVLDGKELDIYLPDLGIAFEFNGVLWHSTQYNDDKNYHVNKTKACEEKGIKLIHVRSDIWEEKQDIIKSRILGMLGKTTKIYGRKTSIVEVGTKEARKFLDETHMQGAGVVGSVRYGLVHEGELVSVMTFGKSRATIGKTSGDQWELLRLSSKLNTTVLGAASKLIKAFIKDYKPTNIKSFALRDWSSKGSVYDKLGFTLSHESAPNYHYQKHGKIVGSRVMFQKHKLEAKLDVFDSKLTEVANCKANGFYQYFDSGNLVYTMSL